MCIFEADVFIIKSKEYSQLFRMLLNKIFFREKYFITETL